RPCRHAAAGARRTGVRGRRGVRRHPGGGGAPAHVGGGRTAGAAGGGRGRGRQLGRGALRRLEPTRKIPPPGDGLLTQTAHTVSPFTLFPWRNSPFVAMGCGTVNAS